MEIQHENEIWSIRGKNEIEVERIKIWKFSACEHLEQPAPVTKPKSQKRTEKFSNSLIIAKRVPNVAPIDNSTSRATE
jgi:hypothetical protein